MKSITIIWHIKYALVGSGINIWVKIINILSHYTPRIKKNMNMKNNILEPIARSVNVIHVFTQLNSSSILLFYRVSCFRTSRRWTLWKKITTHWTRSILVYIYSMLSICLKQPHMTTISTKCKYTCLFPVYIIYLNDSNDSPLSGILLKHHVIYLWRDYVDKHRRSDSSCSGIGLLIYILFRGVSVERCFDFLK